jgi:hypothetical protein
MSSESKHNDDDNDNHIIISEKNVQLVNTPDDKLSHIKDSPISKKTYETDETTTIVSFENEQDNLGYQDTQNIVAVKYDIHELTRLFRALTVLTPVQIRTLELRYIALLTSYKRRLKYVDFIHHFTRTFISLGSVAVPALLSIQSPTSNTPVGLYWTTWLISLSVTCFHNLTTLFRFDKKYFALHMTFEKLKSEGWAYLELSGRYSSQAHHNHQVTHKNQYEHFVHTIEKIQLRQISEEYNGAFEDRKNVPSAQGQGQPGLPLKPTIISSPVTLTSPDTKK